MSLLSYSTPNAHRIFQLVSSRRHICDTEPAVSRFKTYVDKLADGGGMSGDETDRRGKHPITGQRKFFILRPGWRSQKVSDWLRVIDALYTSHRFSPDGRATRGNWVRHRMDSGGVDWGRRPVRGLPQNFYDVTWLRGLSRGERDALEIQPAASLDHSPDVLR